MSKVVLDISMSLDGFIAGEGETPDNPLGRNGSRLHEWMSHAGGDFVQGGTAATIGAVVAGRRTYDLVSGWGGTHPVGPVPVFVLSGSTPEDVPKGELAFTFVGDGAASAVRQAQAVAEGRDVYVLGGASVAQQCLSENLLDEVRIHLVPFLLGKGTQLLGPADLSAANLEKVSAVDAHDVVHLTFQVGK
jgi:dihydrofolate reductase